MTKWNSVNKAIIFFKYVTSLSASEVSGAFKISSWHANTYLQNRRFLCEQF